MKKIILLCAIVLLSGAVTCNAAESPFVFSVTNTVYHEPLMPQGLEFTPPYNLYDYDSKNLVAVYVGLDKDAEKKYLKTASDTDKKTYKNIKKAQEYIKKNKWVKAEEKVPNFIPIKLQFFDYLLKQGDVSGALRTLLEIKDLNAKTPVIQSSDINYNLGVLFFATKQYSQALNYLKNFELNKDLQVNRMIAECYYNLNSYQQVVSSLDKLGNNLAYADKELYFLSYYKLNNKPEAYKFALELAKETPNYINYMRIVNSTKNTDEKLKNLYNARKMTNNAEEIIKANTEIAKIEQQKLEKKVGQVAKGQFLKVPNWNEVLKQLPQGVSPQLLSSEQDKFFAQANSYISKYRGQNLTNAFSSLNQDCNNLIQNVKNEIYQIQQLEAQNALVIEQQRQNQLQQQMIYEQRRQNAIQHQQLYYMRHRYLYY